VGNSSDRLHFNGVHLLQRVVQNTGSVDGLESQHLVVEVTDEQTLCGESVGLNVDIGAGDVLEETRLSNVGVTADEECAGVGVDGGQTAQMLANLLEVEERVLQALTDSGHATEGGALELLALEERLTVLDETDIVAGYCLDQVLGCGKLAEGDAEVVCIVEGVEQILVERVDVGETGESIEDGLNLLGKRFAGELDLAHVESCEVLSAPVLVVPFFISASISFAPVVLRRSCVVARSSQANSSSFGLQEKVPTSNSRNLETCSDLSRQSSLGSAQDNVQELLRRRHRGDILPRRLHFGGIWVLLICVARTDRIPAPLLRKKFVASRLSSILPERRSADTLARPQTPTSEVQCQARPSLDQHV